MTRRTSDDEAYGQGDPRGHDDHRRRDGHRQVEPRGCADQGRLAARPGGTEWPAGDAGVACRSRDVAAPADDATYWLDDEWTTDEDHEWPIPPAVRLDAPVPGDQWFDLAQPDDEVVDLSQPDDAVVDLSGPDDGVLDLAGPDDDLPDCPSEPLTTPAATLECLLALVGPERAGPPAIWLLPVDADRRTLPFVLPVAEVAERADERVAARLVGAVAAALEVAVGGGGAVVVGLVRAAGGDRGPFEISWARALRDAADELGVEVHAVVAIGKARARVLEW